MGSRQTRPTSRPRIKAARRRQPPAFVVTSKDAEDATRAHALIRRAERELRETGDPWAALRELGISPPISDPEWRRRGGRRALDRKDLEDLAGRFINMCTAPGPVRPLYVRMYPRWRQLPVFLEHAADVTRAQREGEPLPPLPAELDWSPDEDVPMSPTAALRNVAAYAGGVTEKWAWELLSRARREKVKTGPNAEILDRLLGSLPRPRNSRV